MSLHILNNELWFPASDETTEDGLLAIGGDLSQERLLLGYKKGIFPWYEGNTPLWWCPDPRFILFPDELRVSKSMQMLLKQNAFHFTINQAFEQVIYHCKNVSRSGQNGTWITDEVEKAYINLHKAGYAISAETWINNELAGGLYGIKLGKVFFGESMFNKYSNASKYAFIKLVDHLKVDDIQLIDCQVYTEHLASLGARMISKKDFLSSLASLIT